MSHHARRRSVISLRAPIRPRSARRLRHFGSRLRQSAELARAVQRLALRTETLAAIANGILFGALRLLSGAGRIRP
ncbi:MAG: hypothetical protein OXG16_08965 [Rhodospirillales bacterium]|nr:hypothetical protein [Rhodospirillales bacterium]MDE0712876.1 hypothetical protein [Rhodospirillales bacterium]